MSVTTRQAPAAERPWGGFGTDFGALAQDGEPAEDRAAIWPAAAVFRSGAMRREAAPAARPARSRPASETLAYEDFDRPRATEPEVIVPTFSLAEVEAARAAAFQDGREAAAGEAAAADHAAIRQAVTALAVELAAARDRLSELAEESAAAVARVLLHSLGAMLPQLTARYGDAELQALVRAILPGLFKEPAVTMRLNPQHCAGIARAIEEHDPDVASRIQIVPSAAIQPGDVRIAWRHGGAVRDTAAIWSQVVEALGMAGLAPSAARETRELEHAG